MHCRSHMSTTTRIPLRYQERKFVFGILWASASIQNSLMFRPTVVSQNLCDTPFANAAIT